MSVIDLPYFPTTPLAGCLHLLDAGLVGIGLPGLSDEQRAAVQNLHIASDAFRDQFSQIAPDVLDAAFGLYLSHLNGGFSPTNARLCHDHLHEVMSPLDAPPISHDIELFSEHHRGASRLVYPNAQVVLYALKDPPLRFRLDVRRGDQILDGIDLSSLDMDRPGFADRAARFVSATASIPLA